MTLEKFYPLLSRNTRITLVDNSENETYFDGRVKHIPPIFDSCEVTNFSISSGGDLLFQIKI